MKHSLKDLKSWQVISGLSVVAACTFFHQAILADDSWQYFLYGKNLIESGVYGEAYGVPDCRREPGYGVFISLVYLAFKFFSSEGLVEPSRTFLTTIIFLQCSISFIAIFTFSRICSAYSVVAKVFFFVFLFSPTVIGMNTVVFSESLFVSLLILSWSMLAWAIEQQSLRIALLASLFLMGASLTKDYLSYLIGISLLVFLFLLAWKTFQRKERIVEAILVLYFSLSFLGPFLWQLRSEYHLGKDAFADRKGIALAGKVVRWENIHLKSDWQPAVYASLGTNFCIDKFGKDRCWPFHMLGADHYGLKTWSHFNAITGNRMDAWHAMKNDLLQRTLKNPLKQLVGSLFEILRIIFIESAPANSSSHPLIKVAPKIWRFGGSLIIWAFAIIGLLRVFSLKGEILNPFHLVIIVSIGQLFYHFIVMAQVTNLVRYGFPIIPSVYLMASMGLVRSWETAGAKWKLR